MPDIVFVRANRNMPINEGGATVLPPLALGSGSPQAYSRTRIGEAGMPANPSGVEQGFAVATLSGRFRNHGYYYGASGDQPDNATTPIF